jgi:hypothetical protein
MGGRLEECECIAVEVLPIFGQPPTAIEPGDRALDDPSLGQRNEPFDVVCALDDFDFQMRQNAGQRDAKDRSSVRAVGEQLLEVGKQAEERRQQGAAAVAILNVGATQGITSDSRSASHRLGV